MSAASGRIRARSVDDLIHRPRGNGVLQPFELLAKRFGKEVCEDANQLPDLDEQSIELDDRPLDAPRVDAVAIEQAPLVRTGRQKRTAQPKREIARQHAEGDAIRLREAKARTIMR